MNYIDTFNINKMHSWTGTFENFYCEKCGKKYENKIDMFIEECEEKNANDI